MFPCEDIHIHTLSVAWYSGIQFLSNWPPPLYRRLRNIYNIITSQSCLTRFLCPGQVFVKKLIKRKARMEIISMASLLDQKVDSICDRINFLSTLQIHWCIPRMKHFSVSYGRINCDLKLARSWCHFSRSLEIRFWIYLGEKQSKLIFWTHWTQLSFNPLLNQSSS